LAFSSPPLKIEDWEADSLVPDGVRRDVFRTKPFLRLYPEGFERGMAPGYVRMEVEESFDLP